MAAVLERLQWNGILALNAQGLLLEEAQKNTLLFLPHYILLHFEYKVLCSKLIALCVSLQKQEDAAQLEQLKKDSQEAFQLASILLPVYKKFLNVPREVEALQRDLLVLAQGLKNWGLNPTDITKPQHAPVTTLNIRKKTDSLNLPRRIIVRLRLLILAIAEQMEKHKDWLRQVDYYVRPLLNFVTILLFLPRLLINLFFFGKHLIASKKWMYEEEKNLSLKQRLSLQIQRRWFELSFDSVYIIAGFLGLFFFTASLLPKAIILAVAVQGVEFFIIALKCAIELSCFRNLLKQYNNMLSDENLDSSKKTGIEAFKNTLERNISHEHKKILVILGNGLLLVAAIICAVPLVFTSSPMVSLVAALISLLCTIFAAVAVKQIDKNKPDDKLKSVEHCKFFQPAPKEDNKPPLELVASP